MRPAGRRPGHRRPRFVEWRVLLERRFTTAYRVWDRAAGRWRFVKCCADERAARRELAVLRALPAHPSLVRVRGLLVLSGRSCLMMEWVPGRSLRQVIQRRGPLPAEEAVAIACQILEALDAVHRRGFVHGDLHDGNVLVATGGQRRVALVDFEHAVPKDGSGRARACRQLAPVPPHLPPELSTGLLDDRSDLYGVGFLCASMLLGRRPRPGEIQARAQPASADHGPARTPADQVVWQVIATATHRSPEGRYPSARAMLAALRRAVASGP
ncbi:MAG TPA: serine/threonine-protein kinase [Limnochordales bacterium]|nr:serine/threonine-protein kinase [Limnochordales bacterium]